MESVTYLPVQIDVVLIINDLREWGWRDSKIEIAAGLGQGYIAQVRAGNIRSPGYDKAARLHNFWLAEKQARQHLQTRTEGVTTV